MVKGVSSPTPLLILPERANSAQSLPWPLDWMQFCHYKYDLNWYSFFSQAHGPMLSLHKCVYMTVTMSAFMDLPMPIAGVYFVGTNQSKKEKIVSWALRKDNKYNGWDWMWGMLGTMSNPYKNLICVFVSSQKDWSKYFPTSYLMSSYALLFWGRNSGISEFLTWSALFTKTFSSIWKHGNANSPAYTVKVPNHFQIRCVPC